MNETPQNISEDYLSPERMSREEIKERLHLYHATPKQKWEAMQREGEILSERELLNRGLITREQLDDFETTSTGEIDRGVGNDQYVFLSISGENYGDVLLEIDPSVLNIPGVIVNTAGDYLHFANNPELERYYQDSQIPGSQFMDYLYWYVNGLPDPEWVFGKRDEKMRDLLTEALIEKFEEGRSDKFKLYMSLFPEIKVPDKLALKYVIEVHQEE